MADIERTLINLIPNTRYVVRVRSYNKLGVRSPWSEALEFKTGDDGSIPATPTGLDTMPGLQAIVVTWDAATEIDFNHYELHADQIPGFIPSPDNLVFRGRVNTYSHPTQSGQRWYFRIRSVDVAGNASPYSDEEDDIPNYLGDQDILAQTISAGKLSASEIISNLVLSGSIKTGSAGARVEIDTDGIRGYALNGVDKSFWYDTGSGSLIISADITAGSVITGAAFVGGSIDIGGGAFAVNSAGALTATNANISGTVNASSGSFSGTIYASGGTLGNLTVTGTLSGGTLSGASLIGGYINIGSGTFVVDTSGDVTMRANNKIGYDYSGGLYVSNESGAADYNWGFQFNHISGGTNYDINILGWIDSTQRHIQFINMMNTQTFIVCDYNGANRTTVNGAVINVSDPKFKTEMKLLKASAKEPFRKKLGKIKNYTFKDKHGDGTKTRAGWDAIQMKEVFPEIVHDDITVGYENGEPVMGSGIAYMESLPYMASAIAEMDIELDELRAIVEELRKPKKEK